MRWQRPPGEECKQGLKGEGVTDRNAFWEHAIVWGTEYLKPKWRDKQLWNPSIHLPPTSPLHG